MDSIKRVWVIYCHIHTESGRRYVGLTSQTWQKRWKNHVNAAKSAKGKGSYHFANAIRKYGADAFSHEVLEVCSTLEEANAAEARWIERHKTRDPIFGFNIEPGGQHKPHPIRKNPWDDPEYRAKCSSNIAYCSTPEARARSKASLNTPESRSKRSASTREAMARPDVQEKRRAFQQDSAYRARIGSSLAQTLSTPEARIRMSAASASSATPEVRARRSASIKAALTNPEVRARVSAASKAALSDPAVKSKVVAGIRRTWAQPGYRDKMSATMRGKKHSAAAITEMRDAYKNRPGVRVDSRALAELRKLAQEQPQLALERLHGALKQGKSLVGAAQLLGVHFLTIKSLLRKLEVAGHQWEDQPLQSESQSDYKFDGPDGEEVHVRAVFSWSYDNIISLRVCKLCGQESVNLEEPGEPCDIAQARQVMES
jgi:hypothetical protein